MTLGGLALAVGILNDDATVVRPTNINRNVAMGKPIEKAIHGAAQIAVPALVSTISICIVFVPMFFLAGVVISSCHSPRPSASRCSSRTVVPTMAAPAAGSRARARQPSRTARTLPAGVRTALREVPGGYHRVLELCVGHAGIFLVAFLGFALLSAAVLFPFLGRDFFPSVDSGQFDALCDEIDRAFREVIPKEELDSIIDNIGLPYSGINPTRTALVGPAISTFRSRSRPTPAPRTNTSSASDLAQAPFSERRSLLPAARRHGDAEIPNFGPPAPIDIQIVGPEPPGNRVFAERLLTRSSTSRERPISVQQPFDNPQLMVAVDRRHEGPAARLAAAGPRSLPTATSGFQTSPSFWLDPKNEAGATASPFSRLSTPSTRSRTSMNVATRRRRRRGAGALGPAVIQAGARGPPGSILGNVALISAAPLGTVSHYNIAPVLDIFGNAVNTDLATVAGKIEHVLASVKSELPRGSRVAVRGQVQTRCSSFVGLLGGLLPDPPRLPADRRQLPVLIDPPSSSPLPAAPSGSTPWPTRTSASRRSRGRSCAWGWRRRTRSSS